MTSRNDVDRTTSKWILDDDRMSITSEPQLIIIRLQEVRSHLLMIPYHLQSKFMLGALTQSKWADLFVSL